MATGSERVFDVVDRDGLAVAVVSGAVVTLVFSFLPLSPLAGGAVAAERAGRGYLASLGVGTLAGVLATIPLAALLVPAVQFVTALGFGVDPGAPTYGVFLAVLAGLFLAYTVGLSALGGPVGVAVERHTGISADPTAWW